MRASFAVRTLRCVGKRWIYGNWKDEDVRWVVVVALKDENDWDCELLLAVSVEWYCGVDAGGEDEGADWYRGRAMGHLHWEGVQFEQ